MSENLSSMFITGLQRLGVENHAAAFLRYSQELLDWNTRINLTAITDPDEVNIKHFLDSLSLLQVYDKPAIRLLDIGSGAGFPGLPLKIVRPAWHVTLLEATGKKTLFLRHMIQILQLDNIEVIHGRAEELAHQSAYHAAFDLVTARAVASLSTLLETSAPYTRTGGSIILPKKGELEDEIQHGKRAAGQLGTRLIAARTVDLPGLDDGRRLLVWEQLKACPALYPRSWATMTKKPLG